MLELNLNATQKIFGLTYKHLKAKFEITLIKIQSYDNLPPLKGFRPKFQYGKAQEMSNGLLKP